jgi:hypothetical protein
MREKKSFLCIGLDTDSEQLAGWSDDEALVFNRNIVEATKKYAVAYKVNVPGTGLPTDSSLRLPS